MFEGMEFIFRITIIKAIKFRPFHFRGGFFIP
jgi:hypothetical protein